MNKKYLVLVSGLLTCLLGVSGQAYAHLAPGGVVIDFEADTFTGTPMPAAVFPAFGQSYQEDGVVHSAIGFGTAPGDSIGNFVGGTSHLHGNSTDGRTGGTLNSNTSFLEPDSGGGFFKLADGDNFSVLGLDVAQMDLSLVGGGFSTLTMRGYTSADLSTSVDVIIGDNGSGTPVSVNGDFDTEAGAGFNGIHLHLDEVAEFGDLYLFEYFFTAPGRGNDPGSTPAFADLGFMIDNVELGAPVVSAVPVPAAVYLFGTAMLGLFGASRKRSHAVAA